MIYTSIESYTTLQGEPNYPLNYTLDTLSLTVAREFRHGLQVRLDNYPAHGQTAQIAQIVHELDYHMENLQRVEE